MRFLRAHLYHSWLVRARSRVPSGPFPTAAVEPPGSADARHHYYRRLHGRSFLRPLPLLLLLLQPSQEHASNPRSLALSCFPCVPAVCCLPGRSGTPADASTLQMPPPPLQSNSVVMYDVYSLPRFRHHPWQQHHPGGPTPCRRRAQSTGGTGNNGTSNSEV